MRPARDTLLNPLASLAACTAAGALCSWRGMDYIV